MGTLWNISKAIHPLFWQRAWVNINNAGQSVQSTEQPMSVHPSQLLDISRNPLLTPPSGLQAPAMHTNLQELWDDSIRLCSSWLVTRSQYEPLGRESRTPAMHFVTYWLLYFSSACSKPSAVLSNSVMENKVRSMPSTSDELIHLILSNCCVWKTNCASAEDCH